MPKLFSPLTLRDITLRNRIGVSPMCQYSSIDGFAGDWHLVHLGSRAAGGAGLVFTEAAAVEARGRISPQDLGIWKDAHIESLARVAGFLTGQGAVPGIQIAHAGRKASTRRPWEAPGQVPPEEGGWRPVAPSPIPFREGDAAPEELSAAEIGCIIEAFAAAARRAAAAGFLVLELHAAHGYLFHEFLSPLANRRGDRYGGPLENRMRALLEAAAAVRRAWPENLPLVVRISATDWVEGGWDLPQSVELARRLKETGVDLIDCSSGGMVPTAAVAVGPGYQVPFAERIRAETGIATAAVGMITDARQAEAIVAEGKADVVLLARELLRNPNWPLAAARELGQKPAPPVQYQRAW
jgi:2,4-dienoyl-CoA reductase-like NADH-dependent reductase (Old Yellow Enzyme family)